MPIFALTLPLVLIMGIAVFFSLRFASTSKAVWYDDAWIYRAKVPVTAHTALETNVYFSATINTSDTTKFQSDCGDLRFTDANGKLLQYYIASGCSSASTVVHVLVPSFPAGASDYYYYYGNANASNGFESADFTAGTGVTVGSVGSEEKGTGPIAYWAFDEATGTSTYDSSSGSRNTGTLGGTTIPSWKPESQCLSGKCLYFDGSSSKVTGSVTMKNVQSISFWVRPNTIATQGLLNLDGGTHKISTNASGVVSATGFTSPIYYLNGNPVSSLTLVRNQWNFVTITTATGFDSNSSFTVGTDGTNFILATIDEVKFYNYARSASQVKANYNAYGTNEGVSASVGGNSQKYLSDGLVGYWKMDDNVSGDAQSLTESSGNSISGSTHYGANTTGMDCTVVGKFGQGCNFDGTDDYISLGSSTTLSQAKSWIFWVKTSSGSQQSIINHNLYYPRIGLDGSSTIGIWDSGGGGTLAINTGVIIADGTWHQIGIILGGDNYFYGYVDGVFKGKNANIYTGTVSGTNIAIALTAGSMGYWNGSLDEIRVYNRSLSSQEVKNLYNTAPGPAGYWKFDEKSGSTPADSSGNNISGTFTGTPKWSTGKFGSGLTFDGSSQAVTATITDPGYSNTIETWVYPTSSIASKTLVTASKLTTDSSSRPTYGTCTGTALSLSTWTHIAVVSDGSGSCKIYQNGVLTATNTTGVTFGTSVSVAASSFSGTMDEVKIYAYARTAQQVVEDMNGGHPTGGSPVGSQTAYWSMDEMNGTSAYDASINTNTLTLSASSWTTSGKTNGAWKGLGTNWLSRTDDDDFDFASTDDASISMWFKSTSATNPASTEYLIAKGRGTPPGYAMYLNTSGFLCLSIDDDSTWNPDDSACTTTDVYDGTWHHVTAEKTGTTEIRLYIDGKSAGSDTSIAATGSLANSGTLYVGDDDGDATNAFNGSIDELKIYRSTLTSAQVAVDMNAGSALSFGVVPTASESAQIIDGAGSTPFAYWPFDEKTGGSVADKSSNGYTGTWVGTGSHWTQGKIGGGGRFDGTSDYVTVSSSNSVRGLAQFTIEGWFNLKTLDGSNHVIFAEYKNGGSVDRVQLTSNGSTSNRILFGGRSLDADSYTTWVSTSTALAPTANTWYHVAAVYDSVTDIHSVYINGVRETNSVTAPGIQDTAPNSAPTIGADPNGSNFWTGALDDIKIYNYARSPAQIAYDYNRGLPRAHWQFDDCSGSTARDSSGNGNNATITIGATGTTSALGTCNSGGGSDAWALGATGKFNSSIRTDLTDDTINVGNIASLGFDRTDPFSLSVWIKTTTDTSMTLMSKQGSSAPFSGWNMQTGSSGLVYFQLVNTYSSNTLEVKTTNSVNYANGNWHLITETYDGSSDPSGVKIYVDGKNQPLTTTVNSLSSSTTNSTSVYLGSRNGSAQLFDGQMDDARIYSYALSASQVQKLYTNGSSAYFGPVTGSP